MSCLSIAPESLKEDGPNELGSTLAHSLWRVSGRAALQHGCRVRYYIGVRSRAINQIHNSTPGAANLKVTEPVSSSPFH